MRIPYISSALIELKPNAEWTLRGDTYADLEWLDKMQPKPTEEEVNAKITELEVAEPFRLLREERNRRLSETDWTQLPDTLINTAVDYIPLEQAWKDYRQELRDLPSKSNPKLDSFGGLDMTSVTWPTPPS